jgi:thiopeptide-type bacteriocin biosynthesis protein
LASHWRSLHAFFPQPQHGDVLILAVEDVLRGLGADAPQWFFIRYGEGGPHIRVRLAGATPASFERVRSRLSDECAALARADPDRAWWQASTVPDEQGRIFEAGEVVEIDYLPETRRYGGEQALALNEGLFHTSTAVALAAIRATGDDRAGRARIAVALTIAAASIVSDSYQELGAFFERYAGFWNALGSAAGPASRQGVLGDAERLRARYRAHREAIMRDAPPATLVEIWRDALVQARSGFADLQSHGRLVSPLTGRTAASREDYAGALDSMFRSQIHMLNNRLGFSPMEEAAWSGGLARLVATA